MIDHSLVYWASPLEIAALRNTSDNMITNNLVKTRLILDMILDNIKSGDKVAVKVHVGEAHNTQYLRHDYVREVVDAIKARGGIPTLVETQGIGNNIENIEICDDYAICLGHRKNAEDHYKIAKLHGYHESIVGAPLEFIDGEYGTDRKIIHINGLKLDEISVAKGLFNYDKMVVVSHFKGHPQAGFGGALKQLGIGCVTKYNKHLAHMSDKLSINSRRCDYKLCKKECIDSCPVNAISIGKEHAIINKSLCYGCLKCSQVCPVKRAIKTPIMNNIDEFVDRFIDNATGVLNSFGRENIRYINFAIDIPLMCDCVPNPGMAVIPDLGIFGSDDPVAIDKACLDAEIDAPGLPLLNKEGQWTEPLQRGLEKFHAMMKLVNPNLQIESAVSNKLGLVNYKLIQI